ncbi:sensor histidine kinase [Deinococcus radiotolerans]|uniref:histidine kinase n=1 Tax=Deinococcus radiotolerans TaxID=1309407 RepID=A0ABQ2FPP6_9DEIO|nr:ATP-binding protein [Deinococcus radiotolerans]GGL14472.1 two-component sensor histidine kinase [Deinococcus radiotolerans]
MRLFPRLLLQHLTGVAVTAAVLVGAAEVSAHPFIQHHVDSMIVQMGAQGGHMRVDLTQGMRDTLTRALLTALPVALVVATLFAWLSARRVTASVRTLQDGSRALASGEYHRRLAVAGEDELAELAGSFNTMAGALERVEQSRVELIGNVAHELRTPMAAVRGYAEAGQDGILPPQEALGANAREMASLERLARDLSLVSRVEGGRVDLHVVALALEGALLQARERFALAFEDRGVTFTVTGPAAGLSIQADAARAQQILANLLGNALRHTPPGGTVRLGAERRGGMAVVTVADTGSGVKAEHLERVFERFFRVDEARTRGEGSGVGLTIARGLARAMRGDVTASSVPGEGSVFTWTVPLAPG